MIKNLTKGRIHKTSLFVQPEYKCNIGCKGCYAVKNIDTTHELAEELTDLGEGIHNDTIQFEQVTISLNDLDPADAEYSAETAHNISEDFGRENTHYACSVNSLLMYKEIMNLEQCGALNISFDRAKWNKIDVGDRMQITDYLDSLKKVNPKLHVNVNFLVEASDDVSIKAENSMMLSYISLVADSIHLIMNKPIKNLFNIDELDSFRAGFEGYIKHALGIKIAYGNKVDIDACVKTLINNLLNDKTYTCRAGVDHASLWPDGKFTGCAYRMPDSTYNGKAGSTLSFLDYDNINDVKISEFTHCLYNKLSVMYGSFEGLCDALDINENEISRLKSLI